jgi:quinol monooxygenase YgiN
MRNRTRKKRAVKAKSSSRTKHSTPERFPKNSVALVVLLRAKEGQGPLLEAELRALVDPTRKEEGCLRYALHRSVDSPDAFFLHEIWATREHHRLHTQTPHFLKWDARKDGLLASREASFWTQLD